MIVAGAYSAEVAADSAIAAPLRWLDRLRRPGATPTGAFITDRMASRATTRFQASRFSNPPNPLWQEDPGVSPPFRAFRVFRS